MPLSFSFPCLPLPLNKVMWKLRLVWKVPGQQHIKDFENLDQCFEGYMKSSVTLKNMVPALYVQLHQSSLEIPTTTQQTVLIR